MCWVVLALALPTLLAGCGGSSSGGGEVSGDVLRIYASQSLKGRLADQAQAILRGERLALADAGGRAGRWRVELVALNDADPKTGIWDPGLVSANARKAAQDDRTIAYLGEMDTGASAVSIPILNETGILNLSPTDTVTGFTRAKGPSSNPGEPDKYYPAHDRTFARLVPPDDVQAAALLDLMQEQKVKRLFVVEDEKLYGQSLARAVFRGARAKGIEPVKSRGIDIEHVDARALAAEVAASGADAFFYAGEPAAQVPLLFQEVGAAAPRIKLFGPSSLADDNFAAELGLADNRTFLTAPWLALRLYPQAARTVAARYAERYSPPTPVQALYGYEAMSLVLDAIRRAGKNGNDRGKVIDQVLDTRGRKSVLGTYSINDDGDISTKDYGAYRVRDGRLQFLRVLDALGT